jgi:tetratricopeptide (TPR) repeat protein
VKSFLALVCVLSIAVPAAAQMRGRSGSRQRAAAADPTANATILSGKVVVGDGGALSESIPIQTVCKGQKRTETHTDGHGNFSFQFGASNRFADQGFDAEADGPSKSGVSQRRDLQGCELQASLAGFTSDVIELDGHIPQSGGVDVGRIVLHRMQGAEGLTISATTAQAPGPARKAWQKGQKQVQNGKLEEAEKSFQTAVGIYAKFAVAWFELGEVQLQRNDPAAAVHSFQQAIAGDPKYVNPYLGLTQIALRAQRWRDLSEATEKVLSLNPVSFPDVWYWNGLSYYFLQNFALAEKSARRGIELDVEHRVHKLEYLLGIVLLQETEYQEADRHLRRFLSVATKPADVAAAQQQLKEVARLSGANLSAGQKQDTGRE